MSEFYILACETPERGGGIYRYALEGDTCELRSHFACDRPMFSVLRGGRLHTLLRDIGEGRGGYFSIGTELSDPSAVRDSLGACPCHLEVDEGDVYHVNYLSGNIVKNCETVAVRSGHGPHPTRQEAAHTHYVSPTPDGYIAATDLGTDTLVFLTRDLETVSEVACPAGYGIRHFVFSRDGAYIYAVNELVPSVSVYSYGGGSATLLDTYPIEVGDKTSTAAAIKLSRDGARLYVSVRGEDILTAWSVDGARLSLLQTIPGGGSGPRDIELVGDSHLVVCNNRSDGFAVFSLSADGILAPQPLLSISLPAPLCCVEIK